MPKNSSTGLQQYMGLTLKTVITLAVITESGGGFCVEGKPLTISRHFALFIIYHYYANFASEDYAQKKKIQTHQFTVQSYNHLVCF